MSSFEEVLKQMEEAGVDDQWLEALDPFKGSTLRRERDAALERAEQAESKVAELSSTALSAQLKDLGVTIDPRHLKLPDDLDVTDRDKLTDWAVEAGLIEQPPPDVPDEELEAHEQQAAASAGAKGKAAGVLTPADVVDWSADRWARFAHDHPDEAEALLQGKEVAAVGA